MKFFRVIFFALSVLIIFTSIEASEKKQKNGKIVKTFVEKIFNDSKFQKKFKNLSFEYDPELLGKVNLRDPEDDEKRFDVVFYRYDIKFEVNYNWYSDGLRVIVKSKFIDYILNDDDLDGEVDFGLITKLTFTENSNRFSKTDYDAERYGYGLEFKPYYQKKYDQVLLVIEEILKE
jgi:hypothetical protein